MEKQDSGKSFVNICFIFFGIGGLLAWNTILSIFDFFNFYQKKYEPPFIFPNINFVLSLIFQFYLLYSKKRFTYKSQILFSFFVSMISMIILPLTVIFIKDSTGFIATCAVIMLQGLANAVSLSCLYAVISYLPFEFIISFSSGQGLSGIIMNLIRYIILFSLGDDSDNEHNIILGSLIFFGISAFFMGLCIVLTLAVYRTPYFISQMRTSGEFDEEPRLGYDALTSEKNDKEALIVNSNSQKGSSHNEPERSLFSYLLDLNFLIFLNYFILFSVFPGVALAPKLFDMTPGYRVNTIIFIYNLSDTIGRYLPSLFRMTKKTLSFMTIIRVILMFTFVLIAALDKEYTQTSIALSIFVVINMFFCAITNGYNTSTAFTLAPEQVPTELKGKSGSSISFFLIVGIFSGTMFASLVMQNII